jgi:acyl-CoA synthetase (AMP-forming)/AMP-acid ligase II
VTFRLHALLADSAQRTPERPVFIKGDRVTSYGDLDRLSSRLAASLRRLGMAPGDRMAMLLDADVDYLVLYYAAAKAGLASVPLHSDTRTKPLVRALEHSGARMVVLDGGNAKYLSGQAARLPDLRYIVCRTPGKIEDATGFELLDLQSLLAGQDELEHGGAEDDALLSIVYTSGTTGEPKGVMLSHRNLVANVRSIVSYLELTHEDRAGMVLPYHYVYGNSVLHTHVAAGATIVQLGDMTFPRTALEGMQAHACTGLSGVPATFARLLSVEDLTRYDLRHLRYLTQAGAAMTPALTERLRAAFGGARIFVMYGQTEAAARLAYVPAADLTRKIGSAGKAIPGVTLKVTDPDGVELPPGELGEVVAQGDNVMLGYFRDPAASARVLRPEGLRTGDMGRMDEDGFLYLVGRQSELIKSGGHRISPHEIEAVLATVAGVHECAVAGVADELLGEAIAAFIVPAPGAQLERRKLLAACLAELPRFKLPLHLRLVDELPRTQSGKLRRVELKDWIASGVGRNL